MMKRPAGSFAAAFQAKKVAKREVKLNPVERKCHEVADSLRKFKDLPVEVSMLLGDVIPFSLALCQEERHAYQQGMVDVLGQELHRQEQFLEVGVAEVEAALDNLAKEREAQEAGLADLETALKAKETEAGEKKNALADCALGFRHAKEGLAEAQGKQRVVDKELEEVDAKRAALSTLIVGILEPLKEGTLDKETVPKAAAELVPMLQCYFHVEESLVPAIPAVLSKEPSARGSFDTMAATQLEDQAKKALQEFATTTKSMEASKAECAAATAAAQEALIAARDAQRVGAGAFTTADEEWKAAEAAVDAAKQALKSFGPEKTRRLKVLQKAQGALECFRDGPLATFKELSTRSSQSGEPASTEATGEMKTEKAAEAETVPAEAADAEMPAAEEVAT